MYRSIRKTGRFLRKSLSLVIAFSMMISVCMISGFSIGVSAASSAGQKFDINLSQNSTWRNLTTLNVRFANASGTILSTHVGATKSNGVFHTVTNTLLNEYRRPDCFSGFLCREIGRASCRERV